MEFIKVLYDFLRPTYVIDPKNAVSMADDTNITIPGCTFAELEHATNSELNNL